MKRTNSLEVINRHERALLEAVRAAQRDGCEMAGLLAHVLGEVCQELPGKAEEFLQHRPGSWEAAELRDLINGTIGWDS